MTSGKIRISYRCQARDTSDACCVLSSGHMGEHYATRGTSAWTWGH